MPLFRGRSATRCLRMIATFSSGVYLLRCFLIPYSHAWFTTLTKQVKVRFHLKRHRCHISTVRVRVGESRSFVAEGTFWRANPDEETTDWRAVCGRTACTVRRAGRPRALPDPYLGNLAATGGCGLMSAPLRQRPSVAAARIGFAPICGSPPDTLAEHVARYPHSAPAESDRRSGWP
jgi:hypothetical protein